MCSIIWFFGFCSTLLELVQCIEYLDFVMNSKARRIILSDIKNESTMFFSEKVLPTNSTCHIRNANQLLGEFTIPHIWSLKKDNLQVWNEHKPKFDKFMLFPLFLKTV